ncbi:hypothetical protein [Burkholderia alba]|uniref:hypothetical protein n=1 Tax=Burkholderia alba TaxID=2683677 RepID=UPI002B05C712|nr:hypothetical protein [Burkholderia alba]
MTPFDYLGALLDWCYAKNKALGFVVATLIAIGAAVAVAYLNQDGATLRIAKRI